MTNTEPYFELESDPALQRHIKIERERARKLRKTSWWRELIAKGLCHYCQQAYPPAELTMDHIVPLARRGKSSKGNVVPSCRPCNGKKNLETPVETILNTLKPSP
ncbi:MAG: HNH endonuclease [Nitrospirales bacterium]|nr:HNH endonuclease [Nitrospira sp.]MDR4500983.1 HNH endonuclease [Nitrospirales bacterium]